MEALTWRDRLDFAAAALIIAAVWWFVVSR
jgi:hypothetical protein